MRVSRLNVRGSTTSAVPSQLLPTNSAGRVFDGLALAGVAAAASAHAAASAIRECVGLRSPPSCLLVSTRIPGERYEMRAG